jgi:hypothetical protein
MPKAVSHSQVAKKGDTVWGITTQALERKLGRKPTNAEINAIVRNATVPSGNVNKIKPGERVKINFGPAAAPAKPTRPPVTSDPKPRGGRVTADPKPRGPGTPNKPKPKPSVTKPLKPKRKKPKPKPTGSTGVRHTDRRNSMRNLKLPERKY